MLQQADVVCHAVAALGNGGQAVQNAAVQLPGIGLTADVKALVETKVPADHAVHFVDFPGIPIKQLQEAGFRTGGSPAAKELHGADDKVQLLQIGDKVLHPECRPLADRDQLGGLIVGVAQGWHGLVRFREYGKIGNHLQQFAPEILKAVPVEHHIRVVGDVAAGSAQVDDAGGGRRGLAVGIHMRHNVVPDFLLPGSGAGKINVRNVGFQLLHLGLGHGQSQGVLRLGKGHPQSAPGLNALLLGKQMEHILGGIAGA